MTTVPQAITELAPVTGFHPSTLDRYMRDLRPRLVPVGPKGGGKSAFHLTHVELAWILLSLIATQPGQACEAAIALGRLVSDSTRGTDLHTWLARALGDRAAWLALSGRGLESSPDIKTDVELTVGPLEVFASWKVEGAPQQEYFREPELRLFQQEQPAVPGVRRTTTIAADVTKHAAELCAHSLRHTTLTSVDKSGRVYHPNGTVSVPDSTAAETENGEAAGLASDGPQTDQPAAQTAPPRNTEHKPSLLTRAMPESLPQADPLPEPIDGDRHASTKRFALVAA
jgi:hypothetical protein